jgi:hypothetical protein
MQPQAAKCREAIRSAFGTKRTGDHVGERLLLSARQTLDRPPQALDAVEMLHLAAIAYLEIFILCF